MTFDHFQPDYAAEFAARAERLTYLRENWDDPIFRAGLWAHYRANPWDFIDDWGCTVDPRNRDVDLPAFVPFKLFPRQREWMQWTLQRWKAREPGLTEKTRDMGMSWCAVALACTLCIFNKDMAIGFGSRKQEYVDKIGHPKSLFWKAREFMRYLPREFQAGWSPATSPLLTLGFPETGSVITGEAGDGIGRGDRAAIYFVDEAAFLERPALVDASLSQTTNCRIDISSVNGMGNPFAQKRHGGKIPVFTFHWRDDPRKDQAWYDRQVEFLDPVTVAQELDINYLASATGLLIPSAWVQAAVGAFKRLGIVASGEKLGALDVADEGPDENGFCVTKGVSVQRVTTWSGAGSDIFQTVLQANSICDEEGILKYWYDADGLGAGVRGDARVANEQRTGPKLSILPFRGSGAVHDPDKAIPDASPDGAPKRDKNARTNLDFFMNAKAQGWWSLRVRFQRTYRAVEAFKAWEAENALAGADLPPDMDAFNDQRPAFVCPYNEADMIDLTEGMEGLSELQSELSQPTFTINTQGKVGVDKAPDGTRSPNRGDCVMIRFAPRKMGFVFLK